MSVAPGSRLGHYEVVASLGAGGMGEVWHARDTRLDRDVALKFLPEAFVSDPERLARFEREAKVLAALNHTNIAQVYGLEGVEPSDSAHGTGPFLVMELVGGPTLEDMARAGALSVTDAIAIAGQIGEAMEAAHEAGIVHRDLKPANVKVRDDGAVKVLDFGLAKAADGGSGSGISGSSLSDSPTMTSPAATAMGVILGTAAYMAPEQAKGRAVDKRADIWAFGVVLYEMLSGRRLFQADTVSEVLAAVLRADIDMAALPAATPERVRRLVARCLDRDPRTRLRDIGEARILLAESDDGQPDQPSPQGSVPKLALGAAVVVAALAGLLGGRLLAPPNGSNPRVQLEHVLADGAQLAQVERRAGSLAVSPDGQTVAFSDGNQIWLRDVSTLAARPLEGTEAERPYGLMFSPDDGNQIAYFSAASGELRKISVTGGLPVPISQARMSTGASWTGETIMYEDLGRIWEVSASGGTPTEVVSVDGTVEQALGQPRRLPGRDEFLMGVRPLTAAWSDGQIVLVSPDGSRRMLIDGGSDGRLLPDGRLLYARDGAVLVADLDHDLQPIGPGTPVLADVAQEYTTGVAEVAVSASGTIVYAPGGVGLSRTLVWVDRDGVEEPIDASPRAYIYPRLSPDGAKIAVEVREDTNDVHIWNVERGGLERLTTGADANYPVWTADSRELIFAQLDGGQANLFRRRWDGTGDVERLTDTSASDYPMAMTPDGQWLLTNSIDAAPGVIGSTPLSGRQTGVAVRRLKLTRLHSPDSESRLIEETAFDQNNGVISPDGDWIAYESTDSGRLDVYVRRLDGRGDRVRVSTSGGGSWPLWSRAGEELFYVDRAARELVSVPVTPGEPMTLGEAESLFSMRPYFALRGRMYDVTSDGQRFIIVKDDPVRQRDRFVVLLNGLDELGTSR